MISKCPDKDTNQPVSYLCISSVQFSHSVVSDSLWPHESQHARPPCPSPTPRFYSNSCPSSRWCHPAISPSVAPFSFCPQSLSASGSFPMSQLFAWSGQSIGVSASASALPMNIQDWSPLGWTGWIIVPWKTHFWFPINVTLDLADSRTSISYIYLENWVINSLKLLLSRSMFQEYSWCFGYSSI